MAECSVYCSDSGYIWKGKDSTCEPLTNSLGILLLKRLQERQNEIFTIDPDTDTTYTCGEIRELAVRCAIELRSRGLKKGDVITICVKNHRYSTVPFLAAIFLGVTVSVMHEIFNKREMERLLVLFNSKMIICDSNVQQKLQEVCDEMNLKIPVALSDTDFENNFCKRSDLETNFEAVDVDVDKDILILLCSSGTTGFMKGIGHTHKTFYHAVCDTSHVINKDDRFLSYSPLVWNSQAWQIICTVLFGSIRIAANWTNSTNALKFIKKYKVNYMISNPNKFMDICTNPNFEDYPEVKNLRVAWTRGSPNTEEQMHFYRSKLPKTHVMNAIGCTEMSMMIAYFDSVTEYELNKSKVWSVGRLCPGVQAKIVDTATRTKSLGPNQEGELLLKAKCMFSGYYLNPDATKNAFTDDGWYITGDLAKFDDDQCLYIVGRLKEILKYNAIMISPSEIEYIINQHPAVKDSCVMGFPHPISGDLPLAFVVKHPDVQLTEDDVIKLVEKNGSDPQRLRGGVVFLPTLPYTATGKIRKSELKKVIEELVAKRT
ncbi:4-coumarate--CoA ligase 1-like [Chrysoperla carnea]|uniref:4-coumarate--CoA ligase 1-like n=1 Tax=Chrysoperla carnea TaxID=189513 RepID=UPI001D078964|nr:4-coumarate--CoA ligase 1-like [Chrysoperla carnea]